MWQWLLSSFDVEFVDAVGKVCANVLRHNDNVLRNVARYTALIWNPLSKANESVLSDGKCDAAAAGSTGPLETTKKVTVDREGPTMK